jgi:ATP-dependent DNA helicase DinG
MSDGSSFDFFKREIGVDQIPRDSVLETTVDSPYDYLHNTRLYIPNGMPLPDSDNPKYIEALAKEIIALIDATNGHTAILFTSYHLLNAVYNLINPELKEYEVFKMSKAARTIIRDFKKSKNGVLFASGSMWEGVDCVGDCLSSVIIPRLPFPIRSAAMEAKKNASRDVPTFIADYAVPEMLIKLRQGAGRLIRSETDSGVLSILDARASDSGAYRKDVAFALRKYPQVNSLEEIREFMHSIKSPQYFEKNKEEGK